MDVNFQFVVQSQMIPDPIPVNLAESLATGAPGLIVNVVNYLDSYDGGGWTILSHSQVVIGSQLVTTFLATRPLIAQRRNGG